MHKLISDLGHGVVINTSRKSVTFKATSTEDPTFLLRRVIRRPNERKIRIGLLQGSSIPITPAEYKTLLTSKWIMTNSLASWPQQFPILKFAISRQSNIYILDSIDVRSTDSYHLKTRAWSQVRSALSNLTEGLVHLEQPTILDVYNPFALYAPFEAPSQDDFENVNKEIALAIENGLRKLEEEKSAGFLRGKVAAEYYRMLAQLQRLELTVGLMTTPSRDDFENEHLEL